MNYTKWNDPKNYGRMTAELAAYTVPENPIFAAREDERIEHSRVQYCMTSVDSLHRRPAEYEAFFGVYLCFGR